MFGVTFAVVEFDIVTFDGNIVTFDNDFVTLAGNVVLFESGVVTFNGIVVLFNGKVVTLNDKVVTLNDKVVTFDNGIVIVDGWSVTFDGDVVPVNGNVVTFFDGIVVFGEKVVTFPSIIFSCIIGIREVCAANSPGGLNEITLNTIQRLMQLTVIATILKRMLPTSKAKACKSILFLFHQTRITPPNKTNKLVIRSTRLYAFMQSRSQQPLFNAMTNTMSFIARLPRTICTNPNTFNIL